MLKVAIFCFCAAILLGSSLRLWARTRDLETQLRMSLLGADLKGHPVIASMSLAYLLARAIGLASIVSAAFLWMIGR